MPNRSSDAADRAWRPIESAPEIELFAVGRDGQLLVEPDGEERDVPGDAVRWSNVFASIFGRPEDHGSGRRQADALRMGDEFTRRWIGQAAGNGETLPRTRATSEEILVTVLAHPTLAAECAASGVVLDATPRLTVDPHSLRSERRDLVWDARIRPLLRARDAKLRLYGSASANVTILTLTPTQPRRIASRWFIRAGVKAMTTVRDRLDGELRRSFGSSMRRPA